MTEFTTFIVFLKTFILFMSITNVIKNISKIFKSVKTRSMFEISKTESLLLWISISYILTIIFI